MLLAVPDSERFHRLFLRELSTAGRASGRVDARPDGRVELFAVEARESSKASVDQVWALLKQVPRWPEWYPGYVAAEADGPLRRGQRGTVTLVDGRRSAFEVFDWDEPRDMTMGGNGPGVRIRFSYHLAANDAGGTDIVLGHTLSGPTSPIFGRLFGRRVAGYLPTAANQLARLAEVPNMDA